MIGEAWAKLESVRNFSNRRHFMAHLGITDPSQRTCQRHRTDQKRRIVEESLRPGTSVDRVARTHALNHWQALIRYVSDGRIEIDNNAVERALLAIALGRNNFLFADPDAGGERAAAIYSLIGSAKLNDLDPEAYLRFVIERIAD